MLGLSLIYGAIVGLSLGLTGGGGAIFAVPLLVYGLHTPAREAVGISLAAVGAMALVGFLARWRLGEVELRTGLIFAVAGMLGTPVGAWLARGISEALLLTLFALLMLVVAVRIWRQAGRTPPAAADPASGNCSAQPTCRRTAEGRLLLTSRCAILLVLVGLGTGVLAGLFGVGGGFVIVPALVLISRMSMQRAVGTSLMAISLVSAAGVTSYLGAGGAFSLVRLWPFVGGGLGGLLVGQRLGRALSGPALERVFAVAMVAVAAFVVLRNLPG